MRSFTRCRAPEEISILQAQRRMPSFALSCQMVMLCLLLAGHLLLLGTDNSRCNVRRRTVSLAISLSRLAKLPLMPFLYGPAPITDLRASASPPRFVIYFKNFRMAAQQCPLCGAYQGSANYKAPAYLWHGEDHRHVYVRGLSSACRQHKCCHA